MARKKQLKKVANTNKKTLDGKKIAMILNEDENIKAPQISHDLKIGIMQARNAKGLTQEKLAQMLNIPKNDINSF